MKKYIIFIVSFLLFYAVLQIISGLILTAVYTPDPSILEDNHPQEVVFGGTSAMPLLIILITATASYILSQKIGKTTKN